LFWYDRPDTSPRKKGGAGGSQNVIGEEPELEFFDRLPTVWDETRVLHGRIGRYAVIARRSSGSWFVGCMNAGEPRTLDIPLDFLTAGRRYMAHIYRDDSAVPTRTHVRVERKLVTRSTVLPATMSAKGGQAVHIEPLEQR
jgi:alpha-glucosidase